MPKQVSGKLGIAIGAPASDRPGVVVGTYGSSPAGPETISDREEGITVPTALAAFDERQAACECASDLAKARKDSIVLMRHQECSKSAEAA